MSTKISWTQQTWNPITGCNKVSPGCENCYALAMSWRLMHIPAMAGKYDGVVKKTEGGKLNWTGDIVMSSLDKPLEVKKPTIWFVNSMSDLFHVKVPFNGIDMIFDIMRQCPHHIFQILTKREERMLEYYQWKEAGNGIKFTQWPLKNVWQGVSVEDKKRKIRMEYLKETSAHIKFVSMEPLLEDLGELNLSGIDWVIVGGESGRDARPMHPKWVQNIQEKCYDKKVAFFFKQWGAWIPFMENAQAPYYTDCRTGLWYDSHDMNFINPETSQPGNYLGGKWMDVMEALQVNEGMDGNDVMYLKLKEKDKNDLFMGERTQQFPENEIIKL